MKIKIHTPLLIIHVILLTITLGGILYFSFQGDSNWIIPFLTIPLINILILPLSSKNETFDPAHPILLILVSLVIGTVLRSFFIISPLQSPAKFLMLLGKDPSILLKGIGCIYIGITCFVIGYFYKVRSVGFLMQKPVFKMEINFKKFTILTAVIIIISLVSAAIFFKKMGVDFSDLAGISKKRFFKLDDGTYAALGYERLFMDLVKPIFFILLIYMIKTGKKLFSFPGFLLMFLGALNIIYPFIESSRTDALYVFIFSCLIYYYIKETFNWKKFLPLILVAAFVLIIMTALRSKVETADDAETNVFIIMVGSLNFLGVDKTSQIIDGVPDKMPYQLGQTLFLWTVAPIPRTMWEGKPEISIGRVIGDKIYEKRTDDTAGGGVTPGFIGELYMNFGLPGVIAGMFLFGLVLKVLYVRFKDVRKQSTYGLMIYILVLIPLSLNLIGGDLSRIIIDTISVIVPVYAFLKFAQKKNLVTYSHTKRQQYS